MYGRSGENVPATAIVFAIVFQKVNDHLVFRVYPVLEVEDTKVRHVPCFQGTPNY